MNRILRKAVVLALAVAGAAVSPAREAWAQAQPQAQRTQTSLATVLNETYAKFKDLKEGKNADYIPALAKVDSNLFGIALVTTDGKIYTVGNAKGEVSIQSISKVFTLAKVIEELGGGIIAVAPGKFGIAVISPPLDDAGNSVRAQRAIEEIVMRLNANPYAAGAPVPTP